MPCPATIYADPIIVVDALLSIARFKRHSVLLLNRQSIYQQLHDARIQIVTDVEPRNLDRLDEGILELTNVYNGDVAELDGVVAVTYSTSRAPNDQLRAALEAAGKEVILVGDCYAPRSVLAATRQGFAAGRAIR